MNSDSGKGVFYDLIDQYAEKRHIVNEHGNLIQLNASWKDATNIYDIYFNRIAQKINNQPQYYLSDAIKVLTDSRYDQTQKLYSIILMQHLSIDNYICFMNAANTSFERGVLDKEVMRFALFPDPNIKNGTTVYYWWLPTWRDQFRKNVHKVADKESITDVLNGTWSLNIIMQ